MPPLLAAEADWPERVAVCGELAAVGVGDEEELAPAEPEEVGAAAAEEAVEEAPDDELAEGCDAEQPTRMSAPAREAERRAHARSDAWP